MTSGNAVDVPPSVRESMRPNAQNLSAAVTAIIFGIAGGFILFAATAKQAGLSEAQTISWIMTGNVLGGIATIVMSLRFRQPLVIMPSLPAVVVMGPMLAQFSPGEMLAGYLMAGVVVLLLGVSGLIRKLARMLPIPIVMAMIAGVFMTYGLKLVHGVSVQPVVGGAIVMAFVLATGFFKRVPPLAVALVVGIAMTLWLLPINLGAVVPSFTLPAFVVPQFSLGVFVSVTLPLVLLVLADILKGYGVLTANDYEPPLNQAVTTSGLVSIVGSFFLCHAVALAGPLTAIVSGKDAGARNQRYTAAVIGAAGLLISGLLAGTILPVVLALPEDVIYVVSGLALLGLLIGALEHAFGSPEHTLGAFAALVIGMSGVTVGGLGAPVLAIVGGVIVWLVTRRKPAASELADEGEQPSVAAAS